MTQVTIGLQLGGQAYSEIILFRISTPSTASRTATLRSRRRPLRSRCIRRVGERRLSDGVAVFTSAKGGLMYEASIGGQSFSFKPY